MCTPRLVSETGNWQHQTLTRPFSATAAVAYSHVGARSTHTCFHMMHAPHACVSRMSLPGSRGRTGPGVDAVDLCGKRDSLGRARVAGAAGQVVKERSALQATHDRALDGRNAVVRVQGLRRAEVLRAAVHTRHLHSAAGLRDSGQPTLFSPAFLDHIVVQIVGKLSMQVQQSEWKLMWSLGGDAFGDWLPELGSRSSVKLNPNEACRYHRRAV